MQRSVYSGIFTALTVLTALGSVFVPVLFIPLALISAVLFSIVTALAYTNAARITSQCVVFAFYMIALIITKDPLPGLLVLMLFYPVGLAVGTAFGAKRNLNSAGAMALLFGSVFFTLVFVVYAISATYPDISLTAAAEGLKETYVTQIEDTLSAVMATQNELSEYANMYSLSTIAAYAFSYIPTVIALWYLFTATVSFWIMKKVFRAFSQDVSFMGDFSGFRVSRTGAFVYFIASVLSLFSMGSAAGTVAMNLSAVMSVVFSYAGVSLISYFLEFKNISSAIRYFIVGILLVLGIVPFGLSYILSLIGLVDSYLNIRERLGNSGY